MGFAAAEEVWVLPLVRELPLFSATLCAWFALQIALARVLPSCVPQWQRLTREQRGDVIVRCCSIVNGVLMSGFAVLYVCTLHTQQWRFSRDFYTTLPYYRYGRVSILAYFTWDLVVCFYYRWSLAWKVHALVSLLGTYTLAFPFSENYSVYYTGCFETSNVFLHAACILRTIASNVTTSADTRTATAKCASAAASHDNTTGDSDTTMTTAQMLVSGSYAALAQRLNAAAASCEYIFALLFLIVRVVLGTYVTVSVITGGSRLLYASVQYARQLHGGANAQSAYTHARAAAAAAAAAAKAGTSVSPASLERVLATGALVHDEVAVVLSMSMLCVVQLLQYVWFVDICKRAISVLAPSYKVKTS